MNFNKEKLLVISPHADDEILGCYGLMNKIKRNGGEVYVQILTMGDYIKINGKKVSKEIWKQEFIKSAKFVGINKFDIAFNTRKIKHLDEVPEAALIELLEFKSQISISKIRPTIVAIPTIFSSHQDHVYAYKAAVAALRPHPQNITFVPKMVISYESPEYYFWSSYSEFGKFSPNFYLELSKDEIENKIKSLNFYQSQILPNQRDGHKVESLAKMRGSEIGVDYAESFHIHRMFF